jgi:hypothetical protein
MGAIDPGLRGCNPINVFWIGCEKPTVFSNLLEKALLTVPFRPAMSGGVSVEFLAIGQNFTTVFRRANWVTSSFAQEDKERKDFSPPNWIKHGSDGDQPPH